MNIAILLFTDFETLDVFGPVEIFGKIKDLYSIKFYSLLGGIITNQHGVSIVTGNVDEIDSQFEVLFIPGGSGTRKEVNNNQLIKKIKELSQKAKYVLTVCTGSALLARTGLLNGKNATSNKKAFTWVIANGKSVNWNKNARWEIDGKFYTSSGVSAGIDMVLGFISDRHGINLARRIANEIEYIWIENKDNDTFKTE